MRLLLTMFQNGTKGLLAQRQEKEANAGLKVEADSAAENSRVRGNVDVISGSFGCCVSMLDLAQKQVLDLLHIYIYISYY